MSNGVVLIVPPPFGSNSDTNASKGFTTGNNQAGVVGTNVDADGIGVAGGIGPNPFIHVAFGYLGCRDPIFNGAVGVYGESGQNGAFGRTASSVPQDNAVYGQNDGAGHGVAGVSNTGIGVFGTSATGLAAKFKGDVEVTGDTRLTNGEDCAEEFDVLRTCL
jgi:hypothetical protein